MKTCKILLILTLVSFVFCDINILIMGKSGAGKSTLVNNLLDASLANVGEGVTGTFEVDIYRLNKYGHKFVVYDTPGLFDSDLDTDDVIKMIGSIEKINIVLLCYDLAQHRLYQDDLATFAKIKQNYGDNILKHSVLVFTKSNMVNNLVSVNKTRYEKINLDVPMINAYDSTTTLWREQLWGMIATRTKNPDYMIEANYIRFTLCDPMKKIIENVKSVGLYPTITQEKVSREYEICVQQKQNNALMNGLTWGIFALTGTIILGVATGGASLMATLAMFGGGSLVAGGLGVSGGSVILPVLGFASGLLFTQLTDVDCKQQIELQLINIIAMNHYDTYRYENGNIAYEGFFANNLPHGKGIAYTEKGGILWSGNFDKGVPDICKNIIF